MSKPLLQKLNDLLETGELLQIVDNELSAAGVLYRVGYSKKGQYLTIVRDYLQSNDIDISHFTPNGKPLVPKIQKVCPVCGSTFHTEPRKDREQVTCSRGCSNTLYRSRENNPNWVDGKGSYRRLALNHYGEKCQECGYESNPLALDVHHIDHNRENNSILNLKVLCANCHTIHHRTKE